jgi:probable rRNA maturation factor
LTLDLFNDSDVEVPISDEIARSSIKAVESGEGVTFSLLELVYVDETEIIDVNRQHMGRDYVTDIITFHYHDEGAKTDLEGSLVMCAPRIMEQAIELGIPVENEFKRVLFHGLLHLCGYADANSADKRIMTRQEDRYLNA